MTVSGLPCGQIASRTLTIHLSMKQILLAFVAYANALVCSHADDLDGRLKPLLAEKCVKCHGNEKANGDVNLQALDALPQFLGNPELTQRVLEAIDQGAMPPDGEPSLNEQDRMDAVAILKGMLRESSQQSPALNIPIQRLNRFQYNYVVRDLFQMNRDVFALPEKLMTRYDDYLPRALGDPLSGRVPDVVHVASDWLSPPAGLQDVKPFPKDLRAEHGFDNQANQLNLSPLLLDAYLRLSVSIVESADFNEKTVGIWTDFFQEPSQAVDRHLEVRKRLEKFLKRAFRSSVDEDVLSRYTSYAQSKMEQGLSFTDSMKKVASAVLSSPLFLYRLPAGESGLDTYALASQLSFFLWSSGPDAELLALAEDGTLNEPAVLKRTVARMLSDPKIERFLDAFPTQWMQLENLMAATPDPRINKYFRLDPERPASVQMVLEPLLLFDTVFIEDRPLSDLIAPTFSYQSDFLKTWYAEALKPPAVDAEQIRIHNQTSDQQRMELKAAMVASQRELNELIEPVRARWLKERGDNPSAGAHADLKPFAAWDFDTDLSDSVGGLDLTAHGNAELRDGSVLLNQSYLQSPPLPIPLKAKTLEVWFRLKDLDQRGGGLMGIQGPGDFFDTIVIGERKNRHWISGSNGFSRTEDFPESYEETVTGDLVHLVMVYAEDGTTTLYRNGQPYGKPFRKGEVTFPRDESSVIFGLRHLPPGGNRFMSVAIDQARLYDRALSISEIEMLADGNPAFLSEKVLTEWLTPDQRLKQQKLIAEIQRSKSELDRVPANLDLAKVAKDLERTFEEGLKTQLRSREFKRAAAEDPRFGGIITNAAMLSMTSGPQRTHPVARGVWIIEVIFNDPPPPPPNDIPPLDEETGAKELTIREQFAAHRKNPSCAGCHTKIDPLGFALENFDITGRWREQYANGRAIDSSGRLLQMHAFEDVVAFKQALIKEKRRFAEAFVEHLLRYALVRELTVHDSLTVESILENCEQDGFRIQSLIREIVLSKPFRASR